MSEQRVAYPNNVIMAIAWRDGIAWAISNPEILGRFEKETGIRGARSGIEALVDEACKVPRTTPAELAEAFMDWFNKEIWGEDPFAERCECGRTPHLPVCPDHPANEEERR